VCVEINGHCVQRVPARFSVVVFPALQLPNVNRLRLVSPPSEDDFGVESTPPGGQI
jgi:hypothetical protein